MNQLTKEESASFYDQKLWLLMSPQERAIFQLGQKLLCMPFDVFHESIEHSIGRPVYTHEIAMSKEELLEEITDKVLYPDKLREIISRAGMGIFRGKADEDYPGHN